MSEGGFSIDVEGEEKAERLLQGISTPGFLGETFNQIGSQLNTDLAEYPPELPDQRYIRTGELGRRWTHEEQVSLFSVTTIIGNNTPYAMMVQDTDAQAEIHQGRWVTTAQAIKNRMIWIGKLILGGIETQIRKYL